MAPESWTNEAHVEPWLLLEARSLAPYNEVDLQVDTDLFIYGFKSIGASQLRNQILDALQASEDLVVRGVAARLLPNVIYENPTLRGLSAYIVALVRGDGVEPAQRWDEQHRQAINDIITRYSDGLGRVLGRAVVLLVGSTGSLGSLLLSKLLEHPAVERVFAYNRPSNFSFKNRQEPAFEAKGIDIGLLNSDKLRHIEKDAAQPNLGLSEADYREIRNSVTLIIHNAWHVNFNMILSSFEDSIHTSRNLIDLGLASAHRENLRFLFISSTGSVQAWNNANGPFPEEVQLDPSVAFGAGYGESKYATERIIAQSGLRATSLRIGQITSGQWTGRDWFPMLVQSSVALGALPNVAGVVSWLREDDVVSAILETAFAETAPPPVLNIVNPQGTSWEDIITFVKNAISERNAQRNEGANRPIWLATLADWSREFERRARDGADDRLTIELLNFFRGLIGGDLEIKFSTARAREVSPTMANMQAIGQEDANAWVNYWFP